MTGSVVIVENINSSNSGDNSARGATCDFNLPQGKYWKIFKPEQHFGRQFIEKLQSSSVWVHFLIGARDWEDPFSAPVLTPLLQTLGPNLTDLEISGSSTGLAQILKLCPNLVHLKHQQSPPSQESLTSGTVRMTPVFIFWNIFTSVQRKLKCLARLETNALVDLTGLETLLRLATNLTSLSICPTTNKPHQLLRSLRNRWSKYKVLQNTYMNQSVKGDKIENIYLFNLIPNLIAGTVNLDYISRWWALVSSSPICYLQHFNGYYRTVKCTAVL